ncbi:MAG: efflux RND transporter permease subunit [Gammaproteobacteria bacterium]
MNFSQWAQTHRRSILFLFAMLALGGIIATCVLPVTLFPNVNFPRVQVSLDAGDRPAEQMALEVTVPVEEAIRRVPGVRDVRSTTSRGTADISVNFDWGTNMATATLQVNAAASQILPDLPPGTRLRTRRMDPTTYPILAYSLTSKKVSLTKLRDIAIYQIRPLLSSINGIARVGVVGGTREEYQVTVDPARLQALGLSMGDVSRALSAANSLAAVGRLEDHYKLYLVISDTRLHNLQQIRQTVLHTAGNGIVRLEDVATVQRSTAPQWIRVNADGHDAVLFQIYQQPSGNSVQIAKEVKARLARYKSQLPDGVHIANWYDQSQLVVAAAASVRDAILIGIALAALVLWIFLRNGKVTIIALLVVPAVLATTVVLLHALGMTFNIMTLGGMAAAVGLIIDDAIVMVEHIMRRLKDSEHDHHKRVMHAALEFFRPLTGSSAATIVIFIPLAFLGGITGAFFKALSLTMASALVISYVVTWLAVPILADHWLTQKDAEAEQHGGMLAHWFISRYDRIMRRLLSRPMLLLVGIVPLLALGLLAYKGTGSGFMPHMDEGGFILDYVSKPGTSLTETNRLLEQVEAIIKANPYVQTYSRRTGTQLGGGVTEAYEGDFFIRLKPLPRPPIEQIMQHVRQQVLQKVPGLDIDEAQLMEDMIGDLTSVPQPIEIKIYSNDQHTLTTLAKKTAKDLRKIPGIVDVFNGINPAGDALDIKVNRVKAAIEGMDPETITRTLREMIAGDVTTRIQQSPKLVGVRVWTARSSHDTVNKLDKLLIRAPDGHLFPLKQVATITAVSGQPQIDRENLKRMVAVTARISGRDLGSVAKDVRHMMNKPGMLPRGVYYQLGGLYKQQQIAFRGLITVLIAAVALVFLLLLFLYEQFRVAIAIMAIPLMALAAVFISLYLTGIELNISAMMGMTMVVGIVTEVAIFYFSEFQFLVNRMSFTEALITAGKNRMRPIAMTTIAAILTLLPLAFAIGQGSAMQQPLAIAIIGGLIVQLPLVLIAMPVLFHLFQGRKK